MNKTILRSLVIMAVCTSAVLCCLSCSKDTEAPQIDSVWNNTASVPSEKIYSAYLEQTVCLHGSGFSNLQKIIVNDVDVAVINTMIYDTDSFITFKIPDSVATSASSGLEYIKVVTSAGESIYKPFLIKSTSEKPTISSVSATTLVSGATLQIKGTNLDGAQDVYLPLAFEQSVKCEMDTTQTATASNLYVIIPSGVNFATGKLKVILQKTDTIASSNYSETVYSSSINFKN